MNGHDWSSSFKQDVETMLVQLTLSLSWCQLKPTNKSTKPEILRNCFLFRISMWRIFTKTHSNESRFVTGQENILFADMFEHLSGRKFDSEGVKWSLKVEAERRNDRRIEYTVCRRVCKWARFSARKFDRLGQWMVIESRGERQNDTSFLSRLCRQKDKQTR